MRYIEEFPEGLVEVVPGVLRGEIDLAVSSDHVESLDDLCFGALKIHYVPGWQELVTPLAAELSRARQAAISADAIQGCVQKRSC